MRYLFYLLACFATLCASAQLSLDASAGVFSWSIGGSGDRYEDELVQEPGPAWAVGLNCNNRPDSAWVGLGFGMRYERREFDVAYGNGGLGGGTRGEEYVRLGSLYINLGLNVKIHSNRRWWARPSMAVLCVNEGVASGWSRSWSMNGGGASAVYKDKYINEYGAPFFLSFELEHLQPLGPLWFIAYCAFAAQSFSLRPDHAPYGRFQYQLGTGLTVGVQLGDGLDLALMRDREARKGH
ncbi:MAG: hypothetical protein IPJ76_12010 [Flavobacteriales bacterium]|nr:MAG: hypothetical protein IPJ76_12010 [Flavobacteriales bacterium]